MIRTTISKSEFNKLTWISLDAITEDVNDIHIEMTNSTTVRISLLGVEELKTMSVSEYRKIIN